MKSPCTVSFVTRAALSAVFGVLAASMCPAQSGSNVSQAAPDPQSVTGSPPSSSSGTIVYGSFDVRLAKPLHSKNSKEGDVVEASILSSAMKDKGGHTVRDIPRGSKVIGGVTEAKVRSKGDLISSLGIVFEKIHFPDGQELAIRGVIYSVLGNSFGPLEQPYARRYPNFLPAHNRPRKPSLPGCLPRQRLAFSSLQTALWAQTQKRSSWTRT